MSSFNIFVDSVSSLLTSSVLSPLSSWLEQNKGVKLSVDEMISILNLPPSPKPSGLPQTGPIPLQIPIPGFLKNTGFISPSNKKSILQSRGRKKISSDPNTTPCVYIYQRNDRKGQTCGEPSEPGLQYCKNCIKKKSVQNSLKVPSTTTSSSLNTTSPSSTQLKEVEVIPIPDKPGFFEETTHHFILQQFQDGTLLALKVRDGNIERNLTDDEKKTANLMSIATTIDDSLELHSNSSTDNSPIID